MDTSKEYIKMCDCEIQDGWEPLIGDFSYLSELNDVSINCGYNREVSCGETWLPRQDQLQEMLDDSPNPARMHNLLIWAGIEFDIKDMRTWEQLWLAFVMWELHQKKWDGETWIGELLNVRQDSK